MVFNATDLDLRVSGCAFEDNRATVNAGAMHLLLNRIGSGASVAVTRSNFTRNEVLFPPATSVALNNGGGALGITLYEADGATNRNTVAISNSVFSMNRANYAAGLFVVAASVSAGAEVDLLVEDCRFLGNEVSFSGAAISLLASIQLTQDGTTGR